MTQSLETANGKLGNERTRAEAVERDLAFTAKLLELKREELHDARTRADAAEAALASTSETLSGMPTTLQSSW